MYRYMILSCVISLIAPVIASDETEKKRTISTAPLAIPRRQDKNVPIVLQNSPRSASPKLLTLCAYGMLGGMQDNSPTTPSTY